MRIFLAGATGVIGRRLIPQLRSAGFTVVGTTRDAAKTGALARLGAEPMVVDMYETDAVRRALESARAQVLIHQLTDLGNIAEASGGMDAARARNARLRAEATPPLIRAAAEAGIARAVVQSICFVYAPGAQPHAESDPIDSPSVQTMESAALNTPGLAGVVLRYGRLWGPGTWAETPAGLASPLHVDAAARAALLAVKRGAAGLYNVAEDDGTVDIAKARRDLGFDPAFRLPG
jgi:nucleoside-diphosphate-sugar epimerase